jgi:hypothetical protein
MALPSLDLELPILLLLLLCSSGAELYPLFLFPWRRSPSSIAAAQWLSPAIESQDPGVWPFPDGVPKWANHRSTRLSHGLNSSDGVSEPDSPASGDESVGGGSGGAARVSEDGGVISVRGASGPWGQPHGPLEMCAARQIANAPTGPVTTMMLLSSSSSSLPSSSL